MDDQCSNGINIFLYLWAWKKVLVELPCEPDIFVSEKKERKKRKKNKIEMMFMIDEIRWKVLVESIAV